MLEFLLALLTTVTVAVLLIPLLRAKQDTTGRLDGELAIYRDQLAEIERERAAGTLPESEAAAARIEVERRILAAGDHPPRRNVPTPRCTSSCRRRWRSSSRCWRSASICRPAAPACPRRRSSPASRRPPPPTSRSPSKSFWPPRARASPRSPTIPRRSPPWARRSRSRPTAR